MAIVVMSVLTNLIEFKKLFRTIFTPFSYKIIAVSEKLSQSLVDGIFLVCKLLKRYRYFRRQTPKHKRTFV